MNIKKTLTKYVILLLIYTGIVRFLEPYGFRLYYTLSDNPIGNHLTIQTMQSIMTLITFILNIVIVIFMIIDAKSKKLLDWLIMIMTIFSPEIGIVIFLVWQIYKEIIKKYEAQLR
jgi:heme A synthase